MELTLDQIMDQMKNNSRSPWENHARNRIKENYEKFTDNLSEFSS
jgi:hypothetical protein